MPHRPYEPIKKPEGEEQLRRALGVIRHSNRSDILRVFEQLEAPTKASALAYRWLWAEVNYRRAHYGTALREFSAWCTHEESEQGALWGRFLARLRCAFIAWRRGEMHLVQRYKDSATTLFNAHPDDLATYEADLEALEAHLLERQGLAEIASLRFTRAYQLAVDTVRWRRAATAASDVGRLLVERQDLPAALKWQLRAKQALQRQPDPFVERVITLRMAKLDKLMRRFVPAKLALERLSSECREDGLTPEVEIGAIAALQEIELSEAIGSTASTVKRASEELERALRIAENDEVRLASPAVHLYRDLARLLLAHSSAPDRVERARAYFQQGLDEALRSKDYSVPDLMHLASDISEYPALIGYGAAAQQKKVVNGVKSALQAMRGELQPRMHGMPRLKGSRQMHLAALAREMAGVQGEQVHAIRGGYVRVHGAEFEVTVGGTWHRLKGAQAKMFGHLLPPGRRVTYVKLANLLTDGGSKVAPSIDALRRRMSDLPEPIKALINDKKSGDKAFWLEPEKPGAVAGAAKT